MNATDIKSSFADRMEGGAFIFRADRGHRLIYVNDKLVRLFECDNPDDLLVYVHFCYDGMIHDPDPRIIQNEIDIQVEKSLNGSGYVFFNIITKKGNVHRVVNHWTLVHDDSMGDVFYSTLYIHRLDNVVNDFDNVTGLIGKRKFEKYAEGINKRCLNSGESIEFAMIYLNLVHFKLLNIERGVNEGNECLKNVSRVLGRVFEDALVSRLADDHFAVFTEYKNVFPRLDDVIKKFGESYGNLYNVVCKFGVYKFTAGEDFFVEKALSCAKVACDYIKRDDKRDVIEYSDELADNIRTTEYVVGNIDEAIRNGWIKVYFQPVVRSLTEGACSMESLVRWVDPEIGFLPPDKFISALEEERCIHKLDCYVVDKVCELIGERLKNGLPAVPASVNFSRLDFIMCDMLAVVEEAVKKHGIPKEYIHIEITESMIASDEDLMRKVIDDFRNAGYEIWMDDFGSGYSSLTLLKEYDFNTLKLDMRFLTPLTEKSKGIIKSVVSMAKEIGMKTLAEGVETREQLEFLREIGCGLIQGYYYGKPEPIEDVFRHLEENGIDKEQLDWSEFYQNASYIARATEMPLEIVEYDGENFRTLFMNKAYKEQVFKEDYPLDEIDRITYQTSSPLLQKYREFAEIAMASKEEESFYYTVGGYYVCLKIKEIAEHDGHHIFRGVIGNLSKDDKDKERKRLDNMLKEMNLLFETVQSVNLSENTITPLLGGFKYVDRDSIDRTDLQKSIRYFAENMVEPSETQRCLDFLASPTLAERVKKTGRGYVADLFHIKQEEGYKKCEASIMMIPGTGENEYLFCVKECVDADVIS